MMSELCQVYGSTEEGSEWVREDSWKLDFKAE